VYRLKMQPVLTPGTNAHFSSSDRFINKILKYTTLRHIIFLVLYLQYFLKETLLWDPKSCGTEYREMG